MPVKVIVKCGGCGTRSLSWRSYAQISTSFNNVVTFSWLNKNVQPAFLMKFLFYPFLQLKPWIWIFHSHIIFVWNPRDRESSKMYSLARLEESGWLLLLLCFRGFWRIKSFLPNQIIPYLSSILPSLGPLLSIIISIPRYFYFILHEFWLRKLLPTHKTRVSIHSADNAISLPTSRLFSCYDH